GLSSRERSPTAPDLPTVSEQGLPDFEAVTWNGIVGPKGVPDDIVAKLNAVIQDVLSDPEVKEKLLAMGTTPIQSTPEEFGRYIVSETDRWGEIVRISGAKPAE